MNEEITRVVFRKWFSPAILAVVALVVAFLLLPTVSHALTNEQKILVGLRGVYVSVADMDPEEEHLGITKAQIQTDVELRLRKAGIRVLTKTPGEPSLYVQVTIAYGSNSPIAPYSVLVGLQEWVTLDRGSRAYGLTWESAYTAGADKRIIEKAIREDLGDRIDYFINDYLAANPK